MFARIKHLSVLIVFATALFLGMVLNLVSADQEYSEDERRRLKQFPVPSFENITDGEYFQSLEAYSLDQFPYREAFRSVNAMTRLKLFNQTDVNGLYIIEESVYRMRYPLNESSIDHAGSLISSIYADYLQGMDVHFSIVPDKNYFVAEEHGYPHMDYGALETTLQDALKNMSYIPLFDKLDIDDYYRTDHHWRQERVVDVAEYFLESLDREYPKQNPYEFHNHSPFRGSYYGHVAMPLEPDTLTYLTNDTIARSYARNPVDDTIRHVYQKSALKGVDSYDVFLGGAHPFTELIDPKSDSDEELILFGDSYANSLAPLLLEGYSKITFVDLRHVSPNILDQYIDFSDQDVLFLYSTSILNDSWMLD